MIERYRSPDPDPGDVYARLGAVSLFTFSTDPPPDMLIARLDAEGHTILYGTGGVGKGTLSAWWIIQLAREARRVLIVDYENHPEEWARRIHGLGGSDLLAAGLIVYVAPLTPAWQGKRGPLWVQADDLRELILTDQTEYVVIDSLTTACLGHKVTDPDVPALYASGLEYLGAVALSLAHVTKEGDLTYPFGSVHWHNLARTTWSLEKDGEALVQTHRKHNNHRKSPTLDVTVTWLDGVPVEVWERPRHEVLADRIRRALGSDELTIREIVKRMNDEVTDDDQTDVKEESISRTLRRGAKASPPTFSKGEGDRWQAV